MENALFTRNTDGGVLVTPPNCEVKLKNGGVQFRYKLPTGGKVAILESPKKGVLDKAHFHKGLMEIYIVHKGHLTIFYESPSGGMGQTDLTEDESTCIFCAKRFVSHSAYQHPHTVFTVQTLGTPVPNPERGNNDWWPVPEELQKYFKFVEESLTNGL